MVEKVTQARIYAKAAFEYALSNNCISEWSVILNNLASIASDERVNKIIKNPEYTSLQKSTFYVGMVGLIENKKICNFIRVLARYNRLALLKHIAKVFDDFKLSHENVVKVRIISAFGLHDEQKNKLTSALENRYGSKVSLEYYTEQQLIGGLVLKIGDKVIDGSIKGQLEQLNKKLAA